MKYSPIKQYGFNILIWLDQGLNVVLYLGDPDETVSSHVGRVKRDNGGIIPRKRWFMRATDWLLEKTDKDHSIEAIEEDEGKEGLIDG